MQRAINHYLRDGAALTVQLQDSESPFRPPVYARQYSPILRRALQRPSPPSLRSRPVRNPAASIAPALATLLGSPRHCPRPAARASGPSTSLQMHFRICAPYVIGIKL